MENYKSVVKTIDPMGKFSGVNVPNPRIREACGVLPIWAMRGPGTLAENLQFNYPFFDQWRESEATVSEDGVYRYPGDPDMYPLMQIEGTTHDGDKHTIFLYDYAMVAHMVNGEFQGSTRMD